MFHKFILLVTSARRGSLDHCLSLPARLCSLRFNLPSFYLQLLWSCPDYLLTAQHGAIPSLPGQQPKAGRVLYAHMAESYRRAERKQMPRVAPAVASCNCSGPLHPTVWFPMELPYHDTICLALELLGTCHYPV